MKDCVMGWILRPFKEEEDLYLYNRTELHFDF